MYRVHAVAAASGFIGAKCHSSPAEGCYTTENFRKDNFAPRRARNCADVIWLRKGRPCRYNAGVISGRQVCAA